MRFVTHKFRCGSWVSHNLTGYGFAYTPVCITSVVYTGSGFWYAQDLLPARRYAEV